MRRRSGGWFAVLLLTWSLAPAADGESIKDVFKDGEVSFKLRYRFEFVDDDLPQFTDDARASTLCGRLGWKTGSYHDFRAFFSFQANTSIGIDDYNSTANGRTEFPVVPDPEDEQMDELWLAYEGVKKTTFKLGRQVILLDNQRFVGPVPWRQLEQTFNAFTVDTRFKTKFLYSHVTRANRVFGDHNPNPALAHTDMNTDLFNVAHDFKKAGKLVGYVYLIDFDDTPLLSQANIGARFTGRHEFTDFWSLIYRGEYAQQSDYKDGGSFIDADYNLAELGVGIPKVDIVVSYEKLGGDGTYAFQTPLATLHAFNGWADRFLITPLDGLRDLHLSVQAKLKGDVQLAGIYHDFTADSGSDDYGTEFDFAARKNFKKGRYSILLKYAGYNADAFAEDVTKWWLQLEANF